MTSGPFRGAFPHQHGDPRTLRERIDAQIAERIEEAVEMAGLELMVEIRKRESRPAPEDTSPSDRDEFRAIVDGFLKHLEEAFHATLPAADARALEEARPASPDARSRLYAGQVFLARRLPDYWQRFEAHRIAFAEIRLATLGGSAGWLKRLFGR